MVTFAANKKTHDPISHSSSKKPLHTHKRPDYNITCKPGTPCIKVSDPGTSIDFSHTSRITLHSNAARGDKTPLILSEKRARIDIPGNTTLSTTNASPALLAQSNGSINLGQNTTITENGGAMHEGAAIIADNGAITSNGPVTYHGASAFTAIHALNGGGVNLDGGGRINGYASVASPLIQIDQNSRVTLSGFGFDKNAPDKFSLPGIEVQGARAAIPGQENNASLSAIHVHGGGNLEIRDSYIRAADIDGGQIAVLHMMNQPEGTAATGPMTATIVNSRLEIKEGGGAVMIVGPGQNQAEITVGSGSELFSSQRERGVLLHAHAKTVLDASNATEAWLHGRILVESGGLDLNLGGSAKWCGALEASDGPVNVSLLGHGEWTGDMATSRDALTSVTIAGDAKWVGDLAHGAHNEASLKLAGNGEWTGNLQVAESQSAQVTLAKKARWTGHLNLADNAVSDIDLSGQSNWRGDVSAHDNALATISLNGSNLWIGASKGAQAVHIGTHARWTVTDNSIVRHALDNYGAIAFSSGDPKTLATSFYAGENGKITLNTVLGGDDSPTDQLTFDTQATGLTSLYIAKAGGVGAMTTGAGIPVVRATESGAESEPGAFRAGERIAQGMYEYALERGVPGSADPLEQNSWYLRSSQPVAQHGVVTTPVNRPARAVFGVISPGPSGPGAIAPGFTPGSVTETPTPAASSAMGSPMGSLADLFADFANVAQGFLPPVAGLGDLAVEPPTPPSFAPWPTAGIATPISPVPTISRPTALPTMPVVAPLPAPATPAATPQGQPQLPAPVMSLAPAPVQAPPQPPVVAAPAPAAITAPTVASANPQAAPPQASSPQPQPQSQSPAQPPVQPVAAPVTPAATPAAAIITPAPAPAPVPAPVPASAIPMTPAGNGGYIVPMYRAETVLYAAIPDVARTLSLATAGTRHDRHGASLLRNDNGSSFAGAWARAFAGSITESASRSLTPSINGHYSGFQIGADLLGYATEYGEGRFGLFGGYASATTSVRGFAEGELNMHVGSLSLSAASAGMYWTHTGPGGWYVDATLTGSHYTSGGKSINGLSPQTSGHGLTLSLEAGLPIAMGHGLSFEPQAQIVYRTLAIQPTKDAFSTLQFRTHDGARLRIGGRLSWEGVLNGVTLKPFVQTSLWAETGKMDRTVYNRTTAIASGSATRGADIDVGLEAAFSDRLSVWAAAGVTRDLKRPEGRADRNAWRLKAGLRIQW